MSSLTPPDLTDAEPELSAADKAAISMLLVESDEEEALKLKEHLAALGLKALAFSSDHGLALKMIAERNFTHIIFSARETSIQAEVFVSRVLATDPETILIPSSFEPNIDNVFNLLRRGCRGFLVLPSSAEGVSSALAIATNGEPFSKAILNAVDRNQAFSALMTQTLDRLAAVTRDAEKYDLARQELPKIIANFKACVNLSRTFAEGGEDELRDKMISYFEKLSSGPATRLGRLRRRLAAEREDEVEVHTPSKNKLPDQK